jgi:hypothetical protein
LSLTEEILEYLKTDDKRILKWKADKDGIYQVGILGEGDECKGDLSKPFLKYNKDQVLEHTFYGPSFIGAPNNILSIGENRICLLVQDFLQQDGPLIIDLIVDDEPPVTSTSIAGGAYNTPQNLTVSCTDSISGCGKTIFTITRDGSTPADPEFDSQDNIITGQEFSDSITALDNQITTVKFRSIDIVGNIEEVNSESYVIIENPINIEVVSNQFNDLSVGMTSTYQDSTNLTWRSNIADRSYSVRINSVDCVSGKVSSGLNAEGKTIVGDIVSTIVAEDLSYGENIIRICARVFPDEQDIDAFDYEFQSIFRWEQVQFSSDILEAPTSVDEGEDVVQLAVTLDPGVVLDTNVSLDYAVNIEGTTAIGGGTDYELLGSGNLDIFAGDVSRDIILLINDDYYSEVSETVEITLSNPQGILLGLKNKHTLTINDNEGSQEVSINLIGTPLISENGGGGVNIMATLSSLSDLPVTVTLNFGGTATYNAVPANSDYIFTSNSIFIPPETLTSSITVNAVDDSQPENDEIVIVTIADVDNGVPDPLQQSLTITIIDNDTSGPTLDYVEYCDTNGNGHLDHVKLTFNKEVLDSSMEGWAGDDAITNINTPIENWHIAGYPIVRLDTTNNFITVDNPCGFSSDGDAGINDTVLWLLLVEKSDEYDTGVKPDLTVVNTGLKEPTFGCHLNTNAESCKVQESADINTSDIVESDMAPPVISKVTGKAAGSIALITFSELVDSNSDLGCSDTDVLTASSFTYNNNYVDAQSSGGIASMGTDNNACDDYKISLNLDNALAAGDIDTDQIAPIPALIFDPAGHQANNLVQAITDPFAPLLHYAIDSNDYNDDISTVNDVTGNGHNGIVDGPIMSTDITEKLGAAYSFDGENDYIDAENPQSLKITGQITLSAWIKPQEISIGSRVIIGKGLSTDNKVFLRIFSGKYQVGSYDGTNYLSESSIPPTDKDIWVHLAGVYDGANWKLYRNGFLVSSDPKSKGALDVNGNWTIGSWSNNADFFKGQIDDVRIYDYALDPVQIKLASAKVPDGLVAYFPLDENANEITGSINNSNISIYGTVQYNCGTAECTDRFGNDNSAFDFNGSTGYIEIKPNSPVLNPPVFTVTAWASKEGEGSSTHGSIITSRAGITEPYGYVLYETNTNRWAGWIGHNSICESPLYGPVWCEAEDTVPILLNKWTHLSLVCDGHELKFYKNGSLVEKGNVDFNPQNFDLNKPLRIGAGATENEFFADYKFNGKIDDIRIYNRPLSDGEVKALAAEPNRGLVAWYPMDGNAGDYSGFGNDGDVLGGAVLTTDRMGNPDSCYQFSSPGDRIEMDPVFSALLGQDPLTYSAWVNLDSLPVSQAPIFTENAAPANTRNYWMINSDGNMYFDQYLPTQNWADSEPLKIEAQVWTHIAVVKNNDNVIFYRDGKLYSESPHTEDYDGSTDQLIASIGSRRHYGTWGGASGNYQYFGKIDNVRLYNRALSTAEIQTLLGDQSDSLVAWYPFDGNANDYSGNNFHGTVFGAGLANDYSGKPNSAYSFDGVNDYIEADGYDIGTGDFSLAAWIKPSSLCATEISCSFFNQGGYNYQQGYVFDMIDGDGKLRLETANGGIDNGTIISGSGAIINNTWQHVAVSVARSAGGNYSRLFLDGVLQAEGNIGNNSISNTLLRIARACPASIRLIFHMDLPSGCALMPVSIMPA